MTRFAVVFLPEARAEMLAAIRYLLAHGGADIAERFEAALAVTLERLAELPRSCPPAREQEAFQQVELRQALIQSHRLIFTIREQEVVILHLRHTALPELADLDSSTP